MEILDTAGQVSSMTVPCCQTFTSEELTRCNAFISVSCLPRTERLDVTTIKQKKANERLALYW